MNRRRIEVVIAVLALVVILAGLAWWHWGGERSEQWVFGPAQSQLLTERYHMAQRWLEQEQDRPVETLESFDQLQWPKHQGGLILLASPAQSLGQWQSTQLRDWVANGGHLVMPAPTGSSDKRIDRRLNPHAITRCAWCSPDEHPDYTPPESSQKTPESDSGTPLRRRSIRYQGADLTLWVNSYINPQQKPDDRVTVHRDADNVAVMAQYAIDAGRVTLLADSDLFMNQRLVYPDHARLLLALADEVAADDGIYLQQRPVQPSLWPWLWGLAPPLWIAALLLIALWLWPKFLRFGPIRRPDTTLSTQMHEHLLATARFDWRHDQSRRLIEAMQEERNRRCQRRFPDWAVLDSRQRCRHLLALLPEVDAEQMQWLLNVRQIHRADDLILYTRLHQKLMHVI